MARKSKKRAARSASRFLLSAHVRRDWFSRCGASLGLASPRRNPKAPPSSAAPSPAAGGIILSQMLCPPSALSERASSHYPAPTATPPTSNGNFDNRLGALGDSVRGSETMRRRGYHRGRPLPLPVPRAVPLAVRVFGHLTGRYIGGACLRQLPRVSSPREMRVNRDASIPAPSRHLRCPSG